MGIDPGLTGGIVVIDGEGQIVDQHVMPAIVTKKKMRSGKTKTTTQLNLPEIAEIISEWSGMVDMVYLEKVASRPGQSAQSVFKFGRVYGVLEGMLSLAQMPTTHVTPREWCKIMHKGTSPDMQPKDRSKVVLSRLYPGIDLRATERSVKPHEGLMDGLLIAEYGRRDFQNL